MAYQGISHVAVRVNNLREAERYYSRLFGLAVAFWEAETPNGWRTLPEGASWDDAHAAGVSLSMCLLSRNNFRVALEEDPAVEPHGVIDHVGLLVEPDDMDAVRAQVAELGVSVVLQRDTLLILDDRFGVRWELTTTVHDDIRAESHGARQGHWLDLSGRRT